MIVRGSTEHPYTRSPATLEFNIYPEFRTATIPLVNLPINDFSSRAKVERQNPQKSKESVPSPRGQQHAQGLKVPGHILNLAKTPTMTCHTQQLLQVWLHAHARRLILQAPAETFHDLSRSLSGEKNGNAKDYLVVAHQEDKTLDNRPLGVF